MRGLSSVGHRLSSSITLHRYIAPAVPTTDPIFEEIAGLLHWYDDADAPSCFDGYFRRSGPADALHLVYNALLEIGQRSDKAVTETLIRLSLQEGITTVDDVHHISVPIWSGARPRILTPTVHLALALQSIRVLVAAQALSLLPAAVSFLLELPLISNTAFRHVLKQIASLPPGSDTRNQLLTNLLRTATTRRYCLDRWTYSTMLFGKDLDSKLVHTIKRHMEVMKVNHRDGDYPRVLRALALSGDPNGAAKVLSHVRQSRRARTIRQRRGVIALGSRPSPSPRPNNQGITIDNVMFLRSFTDARELRHYVHHLSGHRRSKGSDNTRYLDARGWRTYLDQLGSLPTVPGKELVGLFLKLETQIVPVKVDVKMYTSVIASLIEKKDWGLAWNFWERLRLRCVMESDQTARVKQKSQRKWRLDKVALTAGVRLLCRYKQDFSKAFAMVHALASIEENTTIYGSRTPADTALINQLLEEFATGRRTEAVFPIWQEMSRQYEVQRDNETLVTLLRAAAYGSVGGETEVKPRGMDGFASSVADRFQRLVFASRRRRRVAREGAGQSDALFGQRVTALLEAAPAPREDVLWDGMIAWQRARLVFLEVILGNWPGLSTVRAPAYSPGSIIGNPRNTKSTSWSQPRHAQLLVKPITSTYPNHIEFLDESDPHTIPPPPSTSLYPQIVPTDKTFRTYIQLLGEHSLQGQIPLTLAWMRSLAIRPSKNTLATALAYFREVTDDLNPPLMGAYGRGEGKGEYARLTDWVHDWMGTLHGAEELVPDGDAVVRAWMKARKKRESADKWDATLQQWGSRN
ncbi:hypothetical protein FRB93_001945 [Tulasnella sp. JGI-2019a]|nr:hypothetical protein FRB93_001945 [Tulasnella sp. JGI-2019a]